MAIMGPHETYVRQLSPPTMGHHNIIGSSMSFVLWAHRRPTRNFCSAAFLLALGHYNCIGSSKCQSYGPIHAYCQQHCKLILGQYELIGRYPHLSWAHTWASCSFPICVWSAHMKPIQNIHGPIHLYALKLHNGPMLALL